MKKLERVFPYSLDSHEEAVALAQHLGPRFKAAVHDYELRRWGVCVRACGAFRGQGFITPTQEERALAKMLVQITGEVT